MVKLCAQFLENHRDSLGSTRSAAPGLQRRRRLPRRRRALSSRRRRTIMQEINPAKLALLFPREFALCAVQPGDTIALLADLQSRPEDVAAAFAAAEELGADIYEMKVNAVPSWTKVGVETVGA